MGGVFPYEANERCALDGARLAYFVTLDEFHFVKNYLTGQAYVGPLRMSGAAAAKTNCTPASCVDYAFEWRDGSSLPYPSDWYGDGYYGVAMSQGTATGDWMCTMMVGDLHGNRGFL